MNAIMKNKMALILTCLLLIVNHSYSQLPSFGDLGFMNTYKENKFYWGLSFDTCDKLKSIEQTKYKLVYKSGVLTKGKRIGAFDNDSNFYIKYDERGNIIAKQEYTSLGKQSRTYTHKYDECNNTFEVRGYNSDGEWVYLEKYTYNILGALIVEEYYDINTFKKYSHGYNENGNIIESLYTEIHGYPLMQFLVDIFVFEESSREEDICLRLYKSYDENGNLVKDMTYDSNCNWDKNLVNLREIYICEYDSNGNLLKEQKKDYRVGEGKSSIELIHKYDNEGLKKGTNLIYDLRGMTVNIITNFVRDENRKITEIIENQKTPYNKIKYSEKFEYDNYNNILKILFFKNDKPKYLIERQLEYY